MKPASAMKAIAEDNAADKAAAHANQEAIGSHHTSYRCPHCNKFSKMPHHGANAQNDHSKDHGSRNSTAAEPKTKGKLGHRNEKPYDRATAAVHEKLKSLSERDGHQYK